MAYDHYYRSSRYSRSFTKNGDYIPGSALVWDDCSKKKTVNPKTLADQRGREIIRNIMKNSIKSGKVSKEELINALINNDRVRKRFAYFEKMGQTLETVFSNWYDAVMTMVLNEKGNER